MLPASSHSDQSSVHFRLPTSGHRLDDRIPKKGIRIVAIVQDGSLESAGSSDVIVGEPKADNCREPLSRILRQRIKLACPSNAAGTPRNLHGARSEGGAAHFISLPKILQFVHGQYRLSPPSLECPLGDLQTTHLEHCHPADPVFGDTSPITAVSGSKILPYRLWYEHATVFVCFFWALWAHCPLVIRLSK